MKGHGLLAIEGDPGEPVLSFSEVGISKDSQQL